jgi:ATP-dependent RNA helicase DHX37/DHR1
MLARSIAHQVRHDARSVNSSTKLKFMTDGILMREVQTDLLLRKYSVIVIDEAHERNVNTDVLIGILSRVIPLRNKIAKEEADALRARQGHINKESKDKEGVETGDSASRIPQPNDITAPLGPLKLIIMSATLRVDDFAANVKLFPSRPPVVKVDARQHPVTIHFAKQTAPDGDYVNEALKKACKVHSRLPEGGLLIFLSGSDEVEYLCGELRKKYGSKKSAALSAEKEIQETSQAAYDSAFAAAKAAGSDEEAAKAAGEEARVASKELVEKRQRKASGGSGGGLGPAFVLPLYALLPAAQQSRVFEPPPDGYRLVVVATNVAETSITIPGIR